MPNKKDKSITTVYRWDVGNKSLISRDHLIPNEALIDKMVEDSKGSARIPGIRIWLEESAGMG